MNVVRIWVSILLAGSVLPPPIFITHERLLWAFINAEHIATEYRLDNASVHCKILELVNILTGIAILLSPHAILLMHHPASSRK